MNGAHGAAALYHKADQVTRHFAVKALKEFADVLQWRPDGRDSVLDAGCGPGDITADILLPFLPKTFERVVGVDLCEKMISYARHNHNHPRLFFEVMNLDVELTKEIFIDEEPFDHIFSFFCLMWIRNQKLCVQNFHKLLKKGGDMLLVFLSHHPVYDFYKSQSENSRWARYVSDFDRFITPYQQSENPVEEFSKILEDSGFTNCRVKLETTHFVTEGVQNTYGKVTQICVFLLLVSNFSSFGRFLSSCESIYRSDTRRR